MRIHTVGGVHLAMLVSVAMAADLPPLPDAHAPLSETAHLQRVLALAHGSDAEGPPVRVLFYGQSIIAQPWWLDLRDLLETRYPQRSWQIENRALGGHTAEFLIKTAEADVYPYQPDLLIFHDYGDIAAYAEFVHRVRLRTCADVLLIGDHIVYWDDPNEGFGTNNLVVGPSAGTPWFDYVCLPQIALTNGACRADIRTPWKHYLYDHGLSYTNLTVDGIHLNSSGFELMTNLLTPYLIAPVLRPGVDPYQCGRVKRVVLGTNAFQGTNQLTLPFTGSRVLVKVVDGRSAEAGFLVDGRPPSAIPSSYVHGRCSRWPTRWFPAILKIGSKSLPTAETWTLIVDDTTGGAAPVTYHVQGSVTGDDGAGRSDQDFTSTSGKVVILSQDWYWQTYQGGLTNGFQITWTTYLNGVDTVLASDGAGGARWVEVIQGLDDEAHELTVSLPAAGAEQFPEVLVYHPAGSEAGGDDGEASPTIRSLTYDGQLLLCWPESLGGGVRFSSDLVTWAPFADAPPYLGRSQLVIPTSGPSRFLKVGGP